MRGLLSVLASTTLLGTPPVPDGITPIGELDSLEPFRHAQVVLVQRDFGQPQVDVALDAWLSATGDRIEALQLWWSDPVDRYPFSDRMRAKIAPRFERRGPAHVRVHVGGQAHPFAFDVTLHDGHPVASTTVVLADGRRVHDCRVGKANLYAKRLLTVPVGVRSMVVSCTAPDGTAHRAEVASG